LWLFPAISSYSSGFYRNLFVWFLFSAYTLVIVRKARENPIAQNTPRRVYRWFFRVHQVCSALTMIGNVLVLNELLGICIPISSILHYDICGAGIIFLFYGIYYGVLGRDAAEICAETMASAMGINTKKENLPQVKFNPSICCICGSQQGSEDIEPIVTLDCSHSYHDFCIRGWTIIGKKDMCPYCNEKVELRKIFPNPWEKASIYWNNILDIFRYVIVWNPVVIFFLNQILFYLDPQPPK